MACHEKEQATKEIQQNIWYSDTGCSNHMCGNKSAFSILDESYRDSVKFGNDSKVAVTGKGHVTIQTKRDIPQIISDVLYVLELTSNLLSLGQLQEKGYEIVIKN
ncbi:hypothetical protein KY289_028600 [Solanum tuberosum]|nr:hypothetical protein KY289_028600 [Solanum tuberosum]